MDGYAPTAEPAPPPAQDWAGQARPAQWAKTPDAPPALERPWLARLRASRAFLLVVVLPTLLVAAFQYLVAADQYESEAHFIVRGAQPNSSGGLGQLLGLGSSNPSAVEAHGVSDYLLSHDAVAAAGRVLDLPAIFRRPEADLVTRLGPARPAPETLLKYYRRQIQVRFDAETGITVLSVRAFRPADARALTETLLRLGEARINILNQRSSDSSLWVARRQLAEAETGLAQAQTSITSLRQSGRDIDPERTSAAQITLASGLMQQLALARGRLDSMRRSIDPGSPQYIAMADQVRALEIQTAAAQGRLAGAAGSIAPNLGTYEGLRLRQQFAAKRYELAAQALETARERASTQQVFLVRVVEPNLPGKALYPKRLKALATVFFCLLLTYAVGWLILAGVREHAG